MKRAVSLITETAAWLTSLSGALAQKYKCTKIKIQVHKDKNTTAQQQKYNYTKTKKDARYSRNSASRTSTFNRLSNTFFQCSLSNEVF